jgi:hypothetical protein
VAGNECSQMLGVDGSCYTDSSANRVCLQAQNAFPPSTNESSELERSGVDEVR